ncbi:MAG TPA: ATP-dependent DNA ligase [Gemmatimonadales bacterium]|jgi:ATP-dependent DNA ligase
MLALETDYPPMEAAPVDELPVGKEWQYEPKWDGFRCLAFRDGGTVTLMSKSGKLLTRYFPEIVDMVARLSLRQLILDGELLIDHGGVLDFDLLLQRIHPAASRIRKLSTEYPATYVVFDLLARGSKSMVREPLSARRRELEKLSLRFPADDQITLSPATADPKVAKHWFAMAGQGIDGVIAKRLDLPYQSGERTGMRKVKQIRTADCVVGGFRYASNSALVGSLLLGLYDKKGKLDHVGFLSSFRRDDRPALTRKLKTLIKPPGFTGKAPGGPSRWSGKRSMKWEPLAPKLVVEVTYDHWSGGRFRHGTSLVRWRPDKAPKQCTFDQLAHATASAHDLFAG